MKGLLSTIARLGFRLLTTFSSTSALLLKIYDDGKRNRSELDPPYDIPPAASELHGQLLVADMHADTLLMDRGGPDGIRNRNDRGHIDVPRLLDGNVGIQMLTVVTKAPVVFTEPFGTKPDGLRMIARGQKWPKETWNSPRARALYQAKKWDRLVGDNRVEKILTRPNLQNFLAGAFTGDSPRTWIRQPNTDRRTAVLLGLEGVHAFENLNESSTQNEVDAEVGTFFSSGFRLFGVSHYFDNPSAASSQGEAVGASADTGLSALGKKTVRSLHQKNVIFDLAHASPRSIDHLLELSEGPVISSHGGVRTHTDNNRNLESRHVVEIAKRGGVICIGYWKEAVGDVSVEAIISAMEAAVDILEAVPEIADPWDHIGIGSDFDGAVNTLFNCDGHGLLTAGLLERTYPEHIIRRVMGGNVAAFLLKALPGS